MNEILKKVIKVSLAALLITHGLAFFFGMYLTSVVNSGERISTYQEKLSNATQQNIDCKVQVLNKNTEIEHLNQEISRLRLYNNQMSENYNKLIEEDNKLKLKLNSLQNDYNNLKMRYTVLENNCGVSKTPANTQTQSEVQIPAPVVPISEAYTPYMSYPPYGSRGTAPYPTVYATVTPNVVKFSSGLSIGEIVNKIRFDISYFDHNTEGYPYLIQYADETIVRGKGDCTDKALLLFSCLASNGYPVNDMGIATISKCDGQALHDVLMIKNPLVNTDNFGKYHFDFDGETFYILDPTNSLSTNAYEVSPQYKDCLIIGNLYFQNTNRGKGWMPYRIE
ncbi:MAG: hypothetical protein GX941_06120 [Candidatus Methanofastidiosa archaeon]|jgi:hypothetical protein|nr:hypothetical protein [Candidatus Methanofastidiosa archaeon]HPC81371.1 hypothetical protein [Methanofastidiosum sp.]HRS25801.1 hypothetical protein [Methanofastidiosum sp.]